MKISIIIPAFNEEANLKPLVRDLLDLRKKHRLDCEIVIVNDNSVDKTSDIANELSKKHKEVIAVHRKGNRGMGNTLIEGTRKSKGEIIVWVMADRSDDLETIPKMINKLEEGYDVVFGSRYIKGGSSGDLGLFKTVASSGYTNLARFVFGIEVHDITNAFRAFRKSAFNNLNLTSGDFTISPEFAIKAKKKKFKLGEVPTTYSDRIAGKTKFKMMKMGIKYISLLRYRFF